MIVILKISTFTLGRTPRAVRKALLAINIYCESKGYINFGEASPLQKLITASSWHLSDIENGGRYLTRSELGNLVNLPTATVERMLKGERDYVRNRDYLQNIRNVVSDLNNQLREAQTTLLRQLYGDFETDNAKIIQVSTMSNLNTFLILVKMITFFLNGGALLV